MSKQILSIQFKKTKGKLQPSSKLMKEKLKLFVQSLPEDGSVDCIMELRTRNNTKAQLRKIHVCLKEIANEQGDSLQSVKKEIKKQSGMSYLDEDGVRQYESFADCSKEELSNVIENIIQTGHFLNLEFRGTLD